MREPVVSVVTTCFRGMPYLRECIESVQAQDWPHVEHILQDAGSDDDTGEYLASLNHGNLFWRSEPDSGEYEGLNRALQRVTGDILIVLNGDDALLPHACSWAVKHFAAHPEAAVIYGDEHIVDGESLHISDFIAPDYDLEQLLCVEIVPPAQAAFISCEKFREVGFHVDESMTDCGDYEMWVRLACRFPFVHIPEFVTMYRWHDNKSRRPDEVVNHVSAKQYVLDRFFSEAGNMARYGHLHDRALAGLMLWGSESCFWMGAHDAAREYLVQALAHAPEPQKFYKYFMKTVDDRPDFIRVLAEFGSPDLLAAAPEDFAHALG